MLARILGRPAQRIADVFAPKISINITRRNFTVRTAANATEIKDLMRLRYDVFHREYMGKKFPVGYDFDDLDINADHLIVVDNRNQAVVGTYRMILGRATQKFYSQSEFKLESFLATPGTKLELGRACIKKEYRSGILIHLLWRGISEYMQKAEVDFVFGCSSVKTTDVNESAKLMVALEAAGHTANHFGIEPTTPFTFPGYCDALSKARKTSVGLSDVESILPPLIHSYLSMGGKIHGDPALDRDYRCIDLMTILPMEQFADKFSRKYMQ